MSELSSIANRSLADSVSDPTSVEDQVEASSWVIELSCKESLDPAKAPHRRCFVETHKQSNSMN